MTVANIYNVDESQWAKWSAAARMHFNHVYADVLDVGVNLFVHPETVKRQLGAEEFATIAWNAAWTAASQLDKPGVLSEVVEETTTEPRHGRFQPFDNEENFNGEPEPTPQVLEAFSMLRGAHGLHPGEQAVVTAILHLHAEFARLCGDLYELGQKFEDDTLRAPAEEDVIAFFRARQGEQVTLHFKDHAPETEDEADSAFNCDNSEDDGYPGQFATEQSRGVAARCWCDPRTSHLEMNSNLAEVFAERVERYLEALRWVSGSTDFCEGGRAREGWEKLIKPLLDDDLPAQFKHYGGAN